MNAGLYCIEGITLQKYLGHNVSFILQLHLDKEIMIFMKVNNPLTKDSMSLLKQISIPCVSSPDTTFLSNLILFSI
jgi:hypothetical protein